MSVVAIDCEMVEGVVAGKRVNILARVSIVDSNEYVLFNSYVKPTVPITDYRTFVTGITESEIRKGIDFNQARNEVLNIIRGKVVVGYSVHNDLEVLKIDHNPIKNLAQLPKFQQNGQPINLKDLSKEHLGRNIQLRCHDSVEDAKACMALYNKFKSYF